MPMTALEATRVVDQIAATWPAQPWPSTTRKAWVDALTDEARGVSLDAAGRTIGRFRDDGLRTITLTGFVHACRAGSRPAVEDKPRECASCGGDGWVTRDAPHPLRPAMSITESVPCTACGRGQQIAASYGGVA